jgi:hypothetical protein
MKVTEMMMWGENRSNGSKYRKKEGEWGHNAYDSIIELKPRFCTFLLSSRQIWGFISRHWKEIQSLKSVQTTKKTCRTYVSTQHNILEVLDLWPRGATNPENLHEDYKFSVWKLPQIQPNLSVRYKQVLLALLDTVF